MASATPVANDTQQSEQALDTTENGNRQKSKEAMSRPTSPSGKPTIWVQEPIKDQIEEDKSVQSDSFSRQADVNPGYTMTVVSTRRNANGTIGSVYSGNKIRHLKKDDGIPLWRKDIQYSFLRAVFEDETKVFTLDVDGSKGHSFSDIYINAMARSSKTSKVLKEKLLNDRQSAMNMAMICLLVNVGRMNTTLNCTSLLLRILLTAANVMILVFPEMRAQLRTYHSIPCLQLHQESNTQYKGLQDAPRLKSILKGSCEDTDQPNSIEKIQNASVPRTNPVNLIFVLAQYAPKISEQHFFQPRDFFDLVIRSTLSSASRAKAFLWLIWWYLESDFSRDAALNNPFGAGLPNEDDPDGMPIKVPAFEALSEEQANAENVDTEEEKLYGEKMKLVRKRILEEDDTVGPPLKRSSGRKSTFYHCLPLPIVATIAEHDVNLLADFLNDSHTASPARSEAGRTRSPSPSGTPTLNLPRPRKNAARDHEGGRSERNKVPGTTRLILKASRGDREDESSPVPPGSGHAVLNSMTPHSRRARPETQHQRAVAQNRKLRIDKIIHKKLNGVRKNVLKHKATELPPVIRIMQRIHTLPPDYDSEDEGSWGPGGLVPNPDDPEDTREDDYGGEAMQWKKVLDRAVRRIDRLEGYVAPKKPRKRALSPLSAAMPLPLKDIPITAEVPKGRRGAAARARANREGAARKRTLQPAPVIREEEEETRQPPETLDDLDLDLLGEGEGHLGEGEDEMMDSDPNETDDGDLTEDDFSYADPYATVR